MGFDHAYHTFPSYTFPVSAPPPPTPLWQYNVLNVLDWRGAVASEMLNS